VAERDGGAQHAFAADQADLERHAPFGHGQQRDQAIVREIDVADRVARLAQHFADLDLTWSSMGSMLGQLLRRERGQQQVGVVLGDRRVKRQIHRTLAVVSRPENRIGQRTRIHLQTISDQRNGSIGEVCTVTHGTPCCSQGQCICRTRPAARKQRLNSKDKP
jgi:hypothetical protein